MVLSFTSSFAFESTIAKYMSKTVFIASGAFSWLLNFEKSLTEQIEKLWKEGSEEAMIEAGKLIAETLMTNCDDNVNLVKEVE